MPDYDWSNVVANIVQVAGLLDKIYIVYGKQFPSTG